MTIAYTGTATTRVHNDDAGLDLYASEPVTLAPGARHLMPSGTRVALPPGTVGLVCPRCGLAAHHGITALNAPRVVGPGHRSEVMMNLVKLGSVPAGIRAGDRIALLVIVPVLAPVLRHVYDFDDTDRGTQGHGSSGA